MTMSKLTNIFDDDLLRLRKNRALKMLDDDSLFLWNELAARLLDRLSDVKREFPHALDVGSHHGGLKQQLIGHFGITELTELEPIEATLPVKPYSMDLAVSIGSLQWVNDLPHCLMQILHCLKPDGLFIGLMIGEHSLCELRQSLDAAMIKYHGGVSPRISPMISLQDSSTLIGRAGFTLPVVDREHMSISYSNPIKLMHDLRKMGQTNALIERGDIMLSKRLVDYMSDHYREHFPHPEGGVCATFDVITLTGWAPDRSQAKPLKRGSGQVSMKDVLE